MAQVVGQALGGVSVLLFGAWLIAIMAFSLAFPFLCFAVVRNIARINRQLERLNDTLEQRLDPPTPRAVRQPATREPEVGRWVQQSRASSGPQ